MTSLDSERLHSVLGRVFTDRHLLVEALTHSSANTRISYQRLEFLGDRVLGLVVADFLIRTFPEENEGNLARRLSALVDKSMLARVALEAGLGEFIIMSEAERASGGGANENILADVLEALIGAAFLEAGLEECRDMIRRLWGDCLYETVKPPIDPKTALQEWTQGKGLGLPVYDLVGRKGPDHAPVFDVSVTVEGFAPVTAQGTSRRSAEKLAAEIMMKKLGTENADG